MDMGRFSLHNHPLQLLPVKLRLREASLFAFLRLLILQEQHTDEEVEEEETTNEDKDHKETCLSW